MLDTASILCGWLVVAFGDDITRCMFDNVRLLGRKAKHVAQNGGRCFWCVGTTKAASVTPLAAVGQGSPPEASGRRHR